MFLTSLDAPAAAEGAREEGAEREPDGPDRPCSASSALVIFAVMLFTMRAEEGRRPRRRHRSAGDAGGRRRRRAGAGDRPGRRSRHIGASARHRRGADRSAGRRRRLGRPTACCRRRACPRTCWSPTPKIRPSRCWSSTRRGSPTRSSRSAPRRLRGRDDVAVFVVNVDQNIAKYSRVTAGVAVNRSPGPDRDPAAQAHRERSPRQPSPTVSADPRSVNQAVDDAPLQGQAAPSYP